MRLLLVAVGRMKSGPERELLRRYIDRAQASIRGVGLGSVSIIEIDESRARDANQRRTEEIAQIRTKLPPGSRVIFLNENGRSRSSAEIAQAIGTSRDAAIPCFAFVIGGADGLAPDAVASGETLGFGAATFPHQLVRVLAAEQIYRAITILAGHPYHRD